MKLILKIAYDGSGYSGYQTQPERPSIQKTLTDAVSKAYGFDCAVTGCSRTDAGVHALGFCCTVEPTDINNMITAPIGKNHRVISRFLPDDIAIVGEALVDDEFHPRYFVTEKTYIYKMYDSTGADPFKRKRAWHLKHKLGTDAAERMNEAAKYIVGKRDFSSFMASGSKIVDATRTVKALSVEKEGNVYTLKITADGFLYNMVRIITGTLVDCAVGTFEPWEMERIVSSLDRTKAGRTAPPDGLYLYDVKYNVPIDWRLE